MRMTARSKHINDWKQKQKIHYFNDSTTTDSFTLSKQGCCVHSCFHDCTTTHFYSVLCPSVICILISRIEWPCISFRENTPCVAQFLAQQLPFWFTEVHTYMHTFVDMGIWLYFYSQELSLKYSLSFWKAVWELSDSQLCFQYIVNLYFVLTGIMFVPSIFFLKIQGRTCCLYRWLLFCLGYFLSLTR